MSSKRRRSSRPSPAGPGSSLEALEGRMLLSQTRALPFYDLEHTRSPAGRPLTPEVQISHPIGTDPALIGAYQNEGRDLSGVDRQGNRWNLRLTGPGKIIVTDATPNDGSLDDDLVSIRLVGTNLASSRLIGTVQPSSLTPSDPSLVATRGQVKFNSLSAINGVHAITLNGFVLTDTVTLPGQTGRNSTTGIELNGGTYRLAFSTIDASNPTSQNSNTNPLQNPEPIIVSIGDPTNPLKIRPSVYIDRIVNTVYNDTVGTVPASVAQTNPAVILAINGRAADLSFVSITQQTDLSRLVTQNTQPFVIIPPIVVPSDSAAQAYRFPTVATTGRTAIQVKGAHKIKVLGTANNTTVSRSKKPFENSLTGVDGIGKIEIGGVNDAVGIDSRGSIGKIKLGRGLGNPTNNKRLPRDYGIPDNENGYAANGYVGGQIVTEGSIGKIEAAPATRVLLVPTDPYDVQAGPNGYIDYFVQPGTTFTTAIITAAGSIGSVTVVGDSTNTEIRSGFNYYSSVGGIEPISGPSSIGPVSVRGSLIDSVFAASFRPVDGIFGNRNDVAGPGTITGHTNGTALRTSNRTVTLDASGNPVVEITPSTTALGNQGAGYYARHTSKGLPRG